MKNLNSLKKSFLYSLIIIELAIITKINAQDQWEQSLLPNTTGYIVDVEFVNANTGFIAYKTNTDTIKIFETTNKGISFTQFWIGLSAQREFSIAFLNADTGFVYFNDDAYKITSNGNYSRVINNQLSSNKHRIKIFNNGLGYCLFGRLHTQGNQSLIYKTIDSGNSWTAVLNRSYGGSDIFLTDVDVLRSNSDSVVVIGYIRNQSGNHPNSRIGLYITTSNGFSSYREHNYGSNNDSLGFDFVNFLPNGELRILANDGIYNENLEKIYSLQETSPFTPNYGLKFLNESNGFAALNNGKMIETTNGGYNWFEVLNIGGYGTFSTSSEISSIGQISYYGDATNYNFYTLKLYTYLHSFFDNQSASSSFIFDGNSFNTPCTSFLRGGYSSLSCSNIINSGQNNEKIFYKWGDGFMNASHLIDSSDGHDFYFDMSGTTIANFYKTKNISNVSNAINNSGQIKSWRDTAGAINRIHESIGGIFFSKSYDNGINFKREEIVNFSANSLDGNNNTNPSIFEARDNSWNNSNPVTHWDRNKNMVACWERFNSTSGETEIMLSARDYEINSDTTFKWNRWAEGSEDRFTHFSTSSSFRSFPKIFAVSMGFTNLGTPHDNYFLIVPHLRPASNGNKIEVSCRFNYIHADFQIDSGDISDLSVINYPNSYLSVPLHFVYRKGIKIIYYKAQFSADGTMAITKTLEEGPFEISSGDGYASRYKPDISLMNGIPVVSYSANYNAYAMIDYENGGTDIIQISRYPVIKVERKGINDWGDYIIYNSVNVQGNPDIEGSADTKSYLINYSAGNGLFKKVVNVFDHPGYFCDPNTFSGTDSRLIKNSYTGYFGSSLSLLTLSPNAGLYKLDKQNFNITNIVTADAYDNLGGVINLDTVRYSFNLGPLLIKEPDDEIIEISFDPKYTPPAPVMTPVEFNQNLRSNPFLLNESQALLVGCNVTYLKDDIDAVINEVRYSVDLMNKSTDSLHRVLYSDTIHADDSIATEYLRGYYITGIPNGEVSFYVKITVNNEDIPEGNFNINPGYDDNTGAGDNSSGYRTKIIFENSKVQNTTNLIPGEYSLSQNYPNPFNPTTNLEFGISDLGFVSLKVYDLLGKEVKTLVNELKPAGRYSVVFDGSNLSSGVYFYELEAGKFRDIKRMILIK